MCIHFRNVRPQQTFGPYPFSETHLTLALNEVEPFDLLMGKGPFTHKPLVERVFSQLNKFFLAALADQVPPGEHIVSGKEEL
jgi:hypothetical protein